MLYNVAAHEPLNRAPWDPDRAVETVARIVRDTEAHFHPDTWWPVHPRDVEPGDADAPSTTFYFGAAGVVWALEHLRATGAAQLARDPLAELDALRTDNREWLRANGHPDDVASYLMGDTPIELMAYDRAPTAAGADRLERLIAGNREHPSRELMWGAPGTLLAAAFLHERTGDERWADGFRESAATLWSQLESSTELGCRYWTQDLYGRRMTYLGAAHGFVGVAAPLIRGRELLGDDWAAWEPVLVETVLRTARRDGQYANWASHVVDPPRRSPDLAVQICHGAPGVVVCLADLPSSELDEVLVAAGETIWAAGPLTKGAGLCHGTAGNGYALLKLYRRTGDEHWLDRARAFAMHAIGQVERAAAAQGHMRHSLWTGDLGPALYLWDCVREGAAFPSLDVFYA